MAVYMPGTDEVSRWGEMLSMRSVGHRPMLKRMFKVQVCVLLYKEVRFHKRKRKENKSKISTLRNEIVY